MTDNRTPLHNQLTSRFPECKVYYRPPSKLIIEYPAIVYEPKNADATYANNQRYISGTTYKVMLLSKLPGIMDLHRMLDIPHTVHVQSYVNNDIVHEVYNINVNAIN